jgi:hypothetical protein
MFERMQMTRDPIEQQVHAGVRAAGLEFGTDMGQQLANQIRFNEQLRMSIDLSQEFASGFIQDLRRGVDASEALTNALNRLADRLLDMIVNNLVQKAVGGLFGMGMGFSGPMGSVPGVGMGGDPWAGLRFHSGGVVGRGTHYAPAGLFANAPRAHSGAMIGQRGLMPLRANERPIIAEVGERIVPRGAAVGGDTRVQVNVINNASGTKVDTKQRSEGGMSVQDVIISTVQEGVTNGRLDTPFRARFGVGASGKAR